MIVAGFVADMQAPSFYTLPGNEDFAPVPAHPGEDAGADIKACIAEKEAVTKSTATRLLRMYHTDPVTSSMFINGECKKYEEVTLTTIIDRPSICLLPGQTVLVSSGFKIIFQSFKELGFPWSQFIPYYQIVSRSGLAHKHKIIVTNSPGIIDSGYQGWVNVSLTNNSNNCHIFTRGARIAQGIYSLAFDQSLSNRTTDESLFKKSCRAAGGFGSTALT